MGSRRKEENVGNRIGYALPRNGLIGDQGRNRQIPNHHRIRGLRVDVHKEGVCAAVGRLHIGRDHVISGKEVCEIVGGAAAGEDSGLNWLRNHGVIDRKWSTYGGGSDGQHNARMIVGDYDLNSGVAAGSQ